MNLRELRTEKQLTQEEAAKILGISRRTYCSYEQGKLDVSSLKYKYVVDTLRKVGLLDEEHGILTIEKIKEICSDIFEEYNAEYAYLFGSYAKGKATEKSDVDLLLSVPATGLQFFELAETLREALKKKVDVLNVEQLNNNPVLVREILKEGIKIYG